MRCGLRPGSGYRSGARSAAGGPAPYHSVVVDGSGERPAAGPPDPVTPAPNDHTANVRTPHDGTANDHPPAAGRRWARPGWGGPRWLMSVLAAVIAVQLCAGLAALYGTSRQHHPAVAAQPSGSA